VTGEERDAWALAVGAIVGGLAGLCAGLALETWALLFLAWAWWLA